MSKKKIAAIVTALFALLGVVQQLLSALPDSATPAPAPSAQSAGDAGAP